MYNHKCITDSVVLLFTWIGPHLSGVDFPHIRTKVHARRADHISRVKPMYSGIKVYLTTRFARCSHSSSRSPLALTNNYLKRSCYITTPQEQFNKQNTGLKKFLALLTCFPGSPRLPRAPRNPTLPYGGNNTLYFCQPRRKY